MSQKKILIISPEFPLFTNWGGIATFSQNLAILISKLGYEVEVLTFDGQGGKYSNILTKYGKVKCIPLNFDSRFLNILYFIFPFGIIRKVFHLVFPNLLFSLEWNLFLTIFITKHYKKKEILAIHSASYQFPALLYGLVNKTVPHIIHVQGMQSQLNKYEVTISLEHKIFSIIENIYVQNVSTKIVACSKNVYRFLIKNKNYIDKEIVCISNFINPSYFANKKPINVDNIVYFGRLEGRKGVDILVKSFVKLAKKNTKIKLYLVGEDMSKFLHNQISVDCHDLVRILTIKKPQIANRIFFIPRIDSKSLQIRTLINIKGIAVFPSQYEPFGFTTIEAMAMGFITLVSRNGGGSEIIDNLKNGFLAKPSVADVCRLISISRKLNANKIRNITNRAAATVNEKYSVNSKLREYRKLYSSLSIEFFWEYTYVTKLVSNKK